MDVIKKSRQFDFSIGQVAVLWDLGNPGQNGYEIHLVLDNHCNSNYLSGEIGKWSFGYEKGSRENWDKWGEYIAFCLEQCNQETDKLIELTNRLEEIHCTYIPEEPEKSLKALPLIRQLINSDYGGILL